MNSCTAECTAWAAARSEGFVSEETIREGRPDRDGRSFGAS